MHGQFHTETELWIAITCNTWPATAFLMHWSAVFTYVEPPEDIHTQLESSNFHQVKHLLLLKRKKKEQGDRQWLRRLRWGTLKGPRPCQSHNVQRIYCYFTNFRCVENFGGERSWSVRFRSNFGVRECCRCHSMYLSHLGVFLFSVKPLTTENTENKTTPKICKITVPRDCCTMSTLHASPCSIWQMFSISKPEP